MSLEDARAVLWQAPDDAQALQVYADALTELGDPRGEFIQLSSLAEMTPKQQSRYLALRKSEGRLVGPARPFVTSFDFAANGLVRLVHTKGSQLVEGFELLTQLSPRLTVKVTKLREKAKTTLPALSQLPLERFAYLMLGDGGLGDAQLQVLAPGLRRVKRLSLVNNDFTLAGLLALGPTLESLEFMAFSDPGFVKPVLASPGFAALKAVHVESLFSPVERYSAPRAHFTQQVVVDVSPRPMADLQPVEQLVSLALGA